MKRASPAESDHRQFARVITAPHGNQTQCVDHSGVGDLDDAIRGGDRIHAQRLGAFAANTFTGGFPVKMKIASQEVVRVEAPEDEVGIGNGGLLAAFAIADGARVRPRALRPDSQNPAGIDPGDAAAPGADFDEIDHRGPDRIAAASCLTDADHRHGSDFVFLGYFRLSIENKAGLGGSAAHIERNQIAAA